jgi:hypothetical protein
MFPKKDDDSPKKKASKTPKDFEILVDLLNNMLNNMLNGMDINQIAANVNNIDPTQLLSQFGYEQEDASKILNGDMTPILKKTDQNFTLDYDIIKQSYGGTFNDNLICYFYKKAKHKEPFSIEEMKVYASAYNKWFDFIFKIGDNFIYTADETINDVSLIINVNGDYFQMSKMDNINAIIYIKDYL